jgi:hypothetical protein
MTKRAEHSTHLDQSEKHKNPPQPAPQTGKNEHDARGNDSKLTENQRDLGVGKDHKTDEMEQEDRGTFP